nr:unnamed protein product [Spirometra erinaceieuropaei]
MGLFGHMRIHESGIDRSLDTPTPPSPTPNPPPCAPTNHSTADIDATDLTTPHSSPSSSSSSFTATTTAASAHRMGLFGHMRIHESGIDHNSDTAMTSNTSTTPRPILAPPSHAPTTTTNTTASSTADTDTADLSCPHCPRTSTSRIGLVGHLRIHRTETGEPVPGAPTYTHRTRLHCPHCTRTFTHRMGLFGHMRIHDDLR